MSFALHGYKGPVDDPRGVVARAQAAVADPAITIQLLNADRVYSPAHVERAVQLAREAFATGRAHTRELGLEVALYAAGERQITRALDRVGLAADPEARTVVVAIAPTQAAADGAASRAGAALGWTRDDAVVGAGRAALLLMGVSPAELEAVPESRWEALALERTALVGISTG